MSEKRSFTWNDIEENNHKSSLWIVIENKVYDITKFVNEHPGGEEVLLEQAGRDATASFNDVGHSEDAITMREDYYIGDLDPSHPPSQQQLKQLFTETDSGPQGSSSLKSFGFIVITCVLAFIAYKLLS